MPVHGLFITGTDTDAGKSVVTAGVLLALRQLGVAAVPVKPVQTGASRIEPGGVGEIPDLDYCLRVLGLKLTPRERQQLAPFCYEAPCSPHLAARLSGQEGPTAQEIVAALQPAVDPGRFLVVEGAGGIMVPLNGHETMLDLAHDLGCPVLVVVRNRLGCINHALLTLAALKHHRLPVAGVVLNCGDPWTSSLASAMTADHEATIAEFSGVPVLGRVPPLVAEADGLVAWRRLSEDAPALFTWLRASAASLSQGLEGRA